MFFLVSSSIRQGLFSVIPKNTPTKRPKDLVRLEPRTPQLRVKHVTTELRRTPTGPWATRKFLTGCWSCIHVDAFIEEPLYFPYDWYQNLNIAFIVIKSRIDFGKMWGLCNKLLSPSNQLKHADSNLLEYEPCAGKRKFNTYLRCILYP